MGVKRKGAQRLQLPARPDSTDEPIRAPLPEGTFAQIVRVGDHLYLLASIPARPRSREPGPVSASERAVAELLLTGLSHREIAAARHTSTRTVANQLGSLYRKVGIANRNDLIAWWAFLSRAGHHPPPSPVSETSEAIDDGGAPRRS